jgi:formylglycine-generating enzyme required for sulfatase activity
MTRRLARGALLASLLVALTCRGNRVADPLAEEPRGPDRSQWQNRSSDAPPERAVGLAPPGGRVLTNSIGMRLVLIPPGEFDMGSSDEFIDSESRSPRSIAWQNADDAYAPLSEGPRHKVRITKPYWLAATETTQEQYERVTGTNPSRFRGDAKRPVENVSWYDAVEFCRRLSALPEEAAAKRQYQLPTEAQWEYAARAGNQKAWFFSRHEGAATAPEERKLLREYAWISDNSGRAADDYPSRTTHPVATKKPNPWGLYDMYGNADEWCQDWFESYTKAPAVDPTGSAGSVPQPASGCRVVRGGAYISADYYCRSAARSSFKPEVRGDGGGFRVCAVIAEPTAGEVRNGK